MFDDPNAGLGMVYAAAAQNRRVAQEVAQTAEQNANIAHAWKAEAERLAAKVAELERALVVEKAHAGGLDASLRVFIEKSPTSPARADSGRRDRKGAVKTISRIAYESAFDRIALAGGITRPTEHRAD